MTRATDIQFIIRRYGLDVPQDAFNRRFYADLFVREGRAIIVLATEGGKKFQHIYMTDNFLLDAVELIMLRDYVFKHHPALILTAEGRSIYEQITALCDIVTCGAPKHVLASTLPIGDN